MSNIDDLDPQCALRNLVIGEAKPIDRVKTILNTSFRMLGTNSAVIVKQFEASVRKLLLPMEPMETVWE
jgi:3-oxoacyl-[acyl-carrier-protein] synthase II